MSHGKERKENDCLNCGSLLRGRYCQVCGQENIEPHESFWQVAKHFVFDITHFDSKFFDSMRYLITRPGFLPKQYMLGKRASYLNPIKKYVFTSALFFILFFNFFAADNALKLSSDKPMTAAKRAEWNQLVNDSLTKNGNNTKWLYAKNLLADSSKILTNKDMLPFIDTTSFISTGGKSYISLEQYDSVQQSLSGSKKDGWLSQFLLKKGFKLQNKYKNDPQAGVTKLVEIFLHKLPYLLFVSLPLFALVLKLLYFRNKKYFYIDHGIFSVYQYIFTFMLLLLVFIFNKLGDVTHLGIFGTMALLLFLSGGVYLLLSMKSFYGQGWGKTVLKFILLNASTLVILIALFIVFLFLSVILI